jgi:hypothetical protein
MMFMLLIALAIWVIFFGGPGWLLLLVLVLGLVTFIGNTRHPDDFR